MNFSNRIINSTVLRTLTNGYSTADVCDLFLSMKMSNDLGENCYSSYRVKNPNTAAIKAILTGDGHFSERDCKIEMVSGNGYRIPTLVVRLSPSCKLYMVRSNGLIHVKVNDKCMTVKSISGKEAPEIANWIIRQKQNLENYLKEWEGVLTKALKKTKTNNMALLAIKAIFTEAVNDYPELKYEFVEQKRRVRIRVKFPNSRLGVIVDAWWGSYKTRLPEQIESLKILIEAHSKSSIKEFFVTN